MILQQDHHSHKHKHKDKDREKSKDKSRDKHKDKHKDKHRDKVKSTHQQLEFFGVFKTKREWIWYPHLKGQA